MKKIFSIIFICAVIIVPAQESKAWRFGAGLGLQGNNSKFSGGMENANARFQQNSFGNAALGFRARYDHNERWAWTTGLGFCSFGYEFALTENYTLKNPLKRYSTIRNEFGSVEVPVMLNYKFKPSCRNSKWVVGLGYVTRLIGNQKNTSNFTEDAEMNSNSNYLRSEARIKGGVYGAIMFTAGRERTFKNGHILNLSFVFNRGFNNSKARVIYTVDGTEYTHEFTNRGNFTGIRISYYFKPLRKGINKN